MSWVTVSTKVRRELLEKAKEYGVNVSEVLRRALENEVREREREQARRSAALIAERFSVSREDVIRIIRESRDKDGKVRD
ncbi:VapB-type antitoxin [Metallosphaera sedula]|uniref:VapB-type antitoxin n=1 Tax=Metallosphaera prunae TaxID=47304 RepID=A0A4D8RR73_METPR|nr:type II toxin-antitoxin system CcdA family antitoxin [Metallosphaera prunae]QCO29433.1 VapB-type antitoxin [Metallosphaera prunae]